MFGRFTNSLKSYRAAQLVSKPVIIAAGVITILALFIVPLPAAVLDVLIVCNLALALFLLLQALYSGNISNFFAFPSILLLSTFYRLSLNISSTRLILLNGDSGMSAAGHVIEAFGNIVVRGDFVVGAIIFVIISIVNFVVIAKGSARVAEVSARFMLDAMPGKQMSIDADLRAGNITREEASEKRDALARESHFFGAMDGAMKFVQGDAIAGLLITGINAFGGAAIGVSRGLDLSEAITTFGVLTIGDGLVNIIPALLISVAAGVVITQVTDSKAVESDDTMKLGIVVTSVVALVILAVLPGFPVVPFLIVAAAMSLLFFISQLNKKEAISESTSMFRILSPKVKLLSGGNAQHSPLLSISKAEALTLMVAEQYLRSAEQTDNEWVQDLERFAAEVRFDIGQRLGISIPAMRILPKENLPLTSLVVEVRTTQTLQQSFPLGHQFVALSPSQLRAFGIEATSSAEHPLSLVTGSWVSLETSVDFLSELGIRSYTLPQYWVLACYGSALDNLDFLLGIEDIQPIVDAAAASNDLSQTLFSSGNFSVSDFVELIRNLLNEGVSVKDVPRILEEVALFTTRGDSVRRENFSTELYQSVRRRLARAIVLSSASHLGTLRVFEINSDVEDLLSSAAKYWDSPRDAVVMDKESDLLLCERLKILAAPIRERGMGPVVFVCSDEVRAVFYNYIRQRFVSHRWVKVIGASELVQNVAIERIGVLHLN